MQQFEFTAWSLYTGPSNLSNLTPDPSCSWVVGNWDGINIDTTATEVKKDIDARIDLVTESFQKALLNYKTYNRFFVIPEFFFRCKQGPYPYLKVDGENYPVEYIEKVLKEKLFDLIPVDNNYYSIFIGSILTSNVSDYDKFLSSDPVNERLVQLNNCLSSTDLKSLSLSTENKKATAWRRERTQTAVKKSTNTLTAVNDFMKECRANPLCTVRNRGIYFHCNRTMMPEVETFICEKQYESTVDLTMGIFNGQKIEHGGQITEWMANYPSISILGGDKQTDEFSTGSRFTPEFLGNMDIGMEICLDHRKQRVRRTVDMCIVNGADADNFLVIHQIISSGGMQILDYSVAADRSCRIFNADGCDKIYKVYGDESTVILDGDAGIFKGITTGVYNISVQSKWKGTDGNTYYSHSQLAFTTNTSSIDGFNNADGLNNKKAQTYNGSEQEPYNLLTDLYEPEINLIGGVTELFGASTGELHYYSDRSGK